MNTSITLDKIKNILSYYKNINWFNPYDIKSSYESITEDADFNIFKDKAISKISNLLSYIPLYSTSESKAKSIVEIEIENTICIYPNESMFSIRHDTSVSIDEIPLFLIDEDLNTFDARVFGGGVTKEYIKEQPYGQKIASITDIATYNGMPTQAGSSILIKLPEDIYTKYTEKYLLSVIKKYIAAGTNVSIIKYDSSDVEDYKWNLKGSENIE